MGIGTLGERMRAAGPTRGFDYLRIILAVGVVSWHSVYVSGNAAAAHHVLSGPLAPLKALILPMFFSLSGFLVAGSMDRSKTLEGFLALRVLRLMPALALEVALSAFILGGALTTIPRLNYYFNPQFAIYLLNAVGDIHFFLPGVFINNPRPGFVNLSLWTVPYELGCYISLSVLAALGLFAKKRAFILITILILFFLWFYYILANPHGPPSAATLTMPGPGLIVSFLAGICAYLYRDKLPRRGWIATLAALFACALIIHPKAMVLATIPAAYLTVWLGLTNPPPIPILSRGDYSYGLYLFAFPIQQSLAMIPLTRHWEVNLCLSIILGLLYAAFSWHFVEKPLNDQRKKVVALVERTFAPLRKYASGLQPPFEGGDRPSTLT